MRRHPIAKHSRRVLILSTSAGTGHLRAAEALQRAFKLDPRVDEVRHFDALRFTNKVFTDFYSTLYTTLVRDAPSFLGWWYKASDEPWRTDAARHMIDRLNTLKLVKEIRSFRPNITVCTHFMPAGIMSHLIAEGKVQAHLSIVVTDFDFHAMWLSRSFHRYFVAIDETKAHLEMLGLPPERITVSGIPIDPAFRAPVDRRKARQQLGLHPDRTTLLLSGGALGVGPAAFALESLLRLQSDHQIIVLCGRNEELLFRVRELLPHGSERHVVLGYVSNMPELMHASDLFIGKPGGLTASEAIACNLPMVIISPIPGQEERNSDHLLENGIAIKCNELTTIAYKIDRLLERPGRLEQMRENTKLLARPDAAQSVVNTLIEDRLPPLTLDKQYRREIADVAAKTSLP